MNDELHESLEPTVKEKNGLTIVGIGASAGGLEALQQLLPNVPPDDNIAYVIVQHLDPKHRSMLASLLDKHTVMPVSDIRDRLEPESGHVYITPPGSDLIIENGVLVLSDISMGIGPKPSINRFFISLADDQSYNCIGIILSGTGSDGAHGMRAIKAAGGITIVQDPGTSKYDGMPRAAIDTGSVDLVLSPEKIGPELLPIIHSPLLAIEEPELDQASTVITRILNSIKKRNGCDFSEYKRNTIQRRIVRRLALLKLNNFGQYLEYAEDHPEDLDALTQDILISVTSFFRDKDAFNALRPFVTKLIRRKNPGDSIRLWVPGCATGEEAYSLAIMFADILGKDIDVYNLQIYATDIDEDAIVQARKGVYPETGLNDFNQSLLEKYFKRIDNTFQVAKSIRERIVFAKQDIIRDPPFSHLDMITCRNLLIYFNSELQKRIIPIFHYALKADGYLFLGKSESIGKHSDLFTPVVKKWRIFKKKSTGRPVSIRFGGGLLQAAETTPGAPATKREITLADLTNQGIADTYVRKAVLIDERWEVIHVRGELSPYLKWPQGDASWTIIDLAQDFLRPSLRAAIHRVQRENSPVVNKKIRVVGHHEGDFFLNLHVRPVEHKMADKGLIVVIFEEEPAPDLRQKNYSDQEVDDRDLRITELEQELTATREHLQTTVEELETSNEELQSLNEELQSANEELQSSNEELETSNEELQATNEELTTVNEELSVKSNELSAAHSDLENILKRMGLAMVVVDTDGRVKHFTPPATAIFNLMYGDRGRVLTTIASHVTIPNLNEEIQAVIASGKHSEMAVEASIKFYQLRIFPHYDEQDTITGAILTFYDMTEKHGREQEFLALAENSPDIVARFDRELRHIYVNSTIAKTSGISAKEYIGKTNRELGMPSELCDFWDAKIKTVFSEHQLVEFEFDFDTKDGMKTFQTRAVPETSPIGNTISVLCVSRDITDLKNAETALRESNERFRVAIGNSLTAVFMQDTDLKYFWAYNQADEFKPIDIAGKTDYDFFDTQDADSLTKVKRKALNTGEGVREDVSTTINGKVTIFDLVVEPLLDSSGNISGITCAATDITQLKELESALKKALAEKDTLLKEVYHRVKNNMQVVSSLLSLQSGGDCNEETIQALETARSRVLAMASVHNTLYQADSLSDIDIKKFLNELTEVVVEMFAIGGRGVAVEIIGKDMSLGLDQAVPLGLIVNEIMVNSLKHAFADSREPRIDIRLEKGDDATIVISVKDNGPGLPADLDIENHGGFGLTLVRELAINQLDGSLEVNSDQGTEIIIRFREKQ